MNIHLKIQDFETLDSIPDYWSLQDYSILTSRYWLEREDFSALAADGKIKLFKSKKEKRDA